MAEEQELIRQIAGAAARIEVALSDRDVERLVAGGLRRRQQRTARRLIARAAASLCLVAVAAVFVVGRFSSPPLRVAVPRAPGPAPQRQGVLRLSDGSTATALEPNTELALAEDGRKRTTVVLARGRGRFDVKPRPERRFVVEAGAVTITVLGTVFTVERVADRIGLTVETGTVRVGWGVGAAVLSEGESGWYPPLVMSGAGHREASPAATSVRKTTRLPAAEGARRTPPRATAMSLARGLPRSPSGPRAAEPAATPSLAPAADTPPSPPLVVRHGETAEALLAAADGARVAGEPATAAEHLRRLLGEHARDPRAPFAAFTLGRILLIEMRDALGAADAFAQARSLAPQGPLAEDALAREVEALSQGGRPAQAKTRAEDYLRLYPGGRRAKAVRVAGGLE